MKSKNKEPEIPFISTEMASVDVYLGGAVLHRQGTVSLVRGRNRFGIRIPDFSPYAIEDPRIEFGGNTEHCTISRPVESEKEKESAEIEELQTRIAKIEAEGQSYESALKLLQEPGKFCDGIKLSPEEFVNMADLVSEKQIEIRKRIVHLRKQKADAEKELLELRNETKEEAGNSDIIIDLIAPEEITCGFELTYRVDSITWNPFYEIVYQDMKYPLSVNLRGRLVRSGNEKWENIRLHLIHGMAASRHDLPDPKVLCVGFRKSVPDSRFLPGARYGMQRGNSVDFSDRFSAGFSPDDTMYPASGPSGMEQPMKRSTPLKVEKTQVTRELVMRFDLGETHTISEKLTILDIQKQSVPTEYLFSTVPYLDPSVYLTGKIKDFSNYNFISCEARLYMGNTYIGTADIPDGEDELVLSLGRDEALDVSKERTVKKHVEPRLARDQSDHHGFRISLTNHRDETVRVHVIDRLPVSRDQDVRVIRENASENPEFDEETGRLTWDVTIDASEQKTIEYSYRVTYPKGKTISYEEEYRGRW